MLFFIIIVVVIFYLRHHVGAAHEDSGSSQITPHSPQLRGFPPLSLSIDKAEIGTGIVPSGPARMLTCSSPVLSLLLELLLLPLPLLELASCQHTTQPGAA